MEALRRVSAGVLAVLVAGVLAACAGGPFASPIPRPDATPVAALGCPAADDGSAGGSVPDGFAPAAAYLCDPHATRDDAQGTWSGTRLTRYEGDFGPLLAALAEPDEPVWNGACPAIGFAGPLLWLGDDGGRFVPVAYPKDGCGMPRTGAVFAAVDALTVVDEHFEPGQLVDSAAARRDGCPSMTAPLVVLGHPADAVPSLPDPGAMALCRYEADLPQSDAPDASVSSPAFTGSTGLDAAAVAALWDVAAAARPAPAACDDPATRLIVLVPPAATRGTTPPGSGDVAAGPTDAQAGSVAPTAPPGVVPLSPRGESVTVELDGCRRLIDRAHRAFTAPDALLGLLARSSS
ncbi:hypothetical protein GCM10022240_18140 [Microbacterium kribbense]|uniref:Septum formation-related domain-containing protein n=1 Tax=Microbacterium kribbense TaxID=433645 RepID=A0ABP7GP63_9MICO